MAQEPNEMRLAIVERLIRFSQPIATSLEHLSRFDWDYNGEPYVIFEDHVISVLRRFLNDELNAQDVANWADALEVREDVVFDETTEWTQETIHLLSNPMINGEITKPLVIELINNRRG
ncbi:hypothetical protein [Phyllobacterium sp. K27]